MTLLQIIVLSLVQGLTEFLPVSSSAHLILGSHVLGWPDQGLVFDVATHLGTLLAVLVYFRRDLAQMVTPWLQPAADDEEKVPEEQVPVEAEADSAEDEAEPTDDSAEASPEEGEAETADAEVKSDADDGQTEQGEPEEEAEATAETEGDDKEKKD